MPRPVLLPADEQRPDAPPALHPHAGRHLQVRLRGNSKATTPLLFPTFIRNSYFVLLVFDRISWWAPDNSDLSFIYLLRRASQLVCGVLTIFPPKTTVFLCGAPE